MNDDRRYDDTEVEEIFRRAAESREGSPRQPALSPGGLTLRELQEIGEEVGLSKEVVARAAASVDVAPASSGKVRALGVPVGVDHTVSLSRPLVDEEWERLVARLRDTFKAPGQVEVMGRLRQWSNGNLRVSVEPTESGYQLRLHTHKGSVRPLVGGGLALVALALVLVVFSLMTGREVDAMGMVMLAIVGGGMAGVNLIQLPGWAATRARQMEEIGETVAAWTALPPPPE
ncbi:MAG: hypothetical protein HKN72_14485 [Gemmatimonadetes bacterium]|nr:hypothetical protein [Gemmatimonadota bacterium]